jgi:hypothetical protein
MRVAGSAAFVVLVRSATASSVTSAPLAARSLSPGWTRHRCSSAGSRSRALVIIFSKVSVSAMTTRAAESDRIHSACSAEDVS